MRVRTTAAAVLILVLTAAFAAPATVSPPQSAERLVVHRPMPAYPAEARARGLTGAGMFLLRVHIPSGRVTQVLVSRTTGARVLDNAAIAALKRWRFKPGAAPYVAIRSIRLSPPQTTEETLIKLPVRFTLET